MIPASSVAEQQTISTDIQSYPNPLTQSTKISFTSPESGEAEVTIINLLGSEVARLFSGRLSAGAHSFEWDAGQAAAGTYFCVVRTSGGVQRVAMVVSR
jgi:flagellar hook assembly protein FlgD